MRNAFHAIGRLEWQALALVAVVFLAGIAVGAAGDRARGERRGPPPPERRRGRLPVYLEELALTETQHERIKAILDAQKPKVDAVMAGVLPSLRAVSDSTFVQLRSVLTAVPQEQFDRDRPRRDLAPGMPGGPRGGGPPPGQADPPDRGGPRGRQGPPPDGRGAP